jgi:ATP-binding cassette, subfamily D (ALD), peroxisomal long-chain fatty acid import protein
MANQSTLRHSEDPFLALYRRYAAIANERFKRTSRAGKLLAAVLFTTSLLGGYYGLRKWWKRRKSEKETGRRLLRRNSGLRGKDGSRTIYVPYRNSTAKVVIYPTRPTTFDAHRRLFLEPPREAGLAGGNTPQIPPPQTRPGLNLAFLHQFLSLLSIMVPRWNSKESGLLLSHSVFLLIRTYLSLVVARLDGEIVRDLVAGNGKAFMFGIFKWCGIGGVASYVVS